MTTTVTAATVGATPLVAFTPFTSEEIHAFTQGDCWELARTLGANHNLSVVIVSFPFMGLVHAGAKLPDGRIIDIEGIWTQEDWVKRSEEDCGFSTGVLKFTEYSASEYEARLKGESFTEDEGKLYGPEVSARSEFKYPEYTQRASEYASILMGLVG